MKEEASRKGKGNTIVLGRKDSSIEEMEKWVK